MSQQTKWEPLGVDRLLLQLDDDIYVIKPREVSYHIPLFCPVCDIVMNKAPDMYTYEKFQCCEWCANQWAYSKAEMWNDAWRPSKSDVIAAMKKRNRVPLGFND
jgi:hypothetical protein